VHDVDEAVGAGVDDFNFVLVGGSSPSRQPPNQPGYWHDDVEVGDEEVVVAVGAGAGVVVCEVFVVVVFSPLSSLQPNQPGVLHVDVEDVDVLLDVEVFVPVVDSSRQPHQPGVLHVSVLVRVLILLDFEVDVGLEVLVVVVSVPLLSKYFQV
jgi:hypothetical protein